MMKEQFARDVYTDLDLGQCDLAWIDGRGKGAGSAHGGTSSKAVCRRTNREAIPEDGHAANTGRHRRHRLKLAKSKTAPALAMAGSLLSPGPDPCRLSVLAKKPECPPECPRCLPSAVLSAFDSAECAHIQMRKDYPQLIDSPSGVLSIKRREPGVNSHK